MKGGGKKARKAKRRASASTSNREREDLGAWKGGVGVVWKSLPTEVLEASGTKICQKGKDEMPRVTGKGPLRAESTQTRGGERGLALAGIWFRGENITRKRHT